MRLSTTDPGLLVAIPLVLVAWSLLLLSTRRHRRLARTFPELARVPLLRPFVR